MLRSLQAGRGLAALAVAAFHLSINMGAERYGGVPAFQEITRFGDRGVDFFFVLSGFIILLAHNRDIGVPGQFGRYFLRRVIRVYPVYLLYTAGFVAVFLVFGGTDARIPTTGVDWLTSLSLIRFSDASPPLQVAWTLFHEVAFYAVFGALVLGRWVGALALGAFSVPALIVLNFPGESHRDPATVYSAAYNLLFLFGMLAWVLHRRPGTGTVELWAGGVLVVASFWFGQGAGAWPGLVLGGGFALIIAGVTKKEAAGGFTTPRWAGFLGDASYTIYLTHVSVQGVFLKIAMKAGFWGLLSAEAIFFFVFLATVAVGCVAYVVVEKPLLRMLRARVENRG